LSFRSAASSREEFALRRHQQIPHPKNWVRNDKGFIEINSDKEIQFGEVKMSKRNRIGVRVAWCCVVFFLALAAQAQWTPANPVKDVHQQTDGAQFTMGTGTLKLQVCTDSIVRVLYSPTSAFPNLKDYVVTKTAWPGAKFTMQSAGDNVTITTARLKLVVSRIDGSITYQDANGKQLVQEANRRLTPAKVNGESTYRAESFVNVYGSREAFYGLGQHQAGVWNYRGESVDISQDNTNIAVPFLVSSNGYGIFWNNTSRSRFNNRFANYLYISSEVADVIDYYFFYGPDLDKVIASYRELTGQAPLFGKWAYGFWQCKNRYKSQDEILGVAKKYRDLHIPLDNIVQDWFWWNRKGEHVFNKNYPDPKGMVDELHRENVHLMISVWPFFEPGSAVYDDMDKKGWFVDKFKFAKPPYHTAGMAVYDATNPEARKYYWNLMEQALFNIGVDAWWLDTTEPETEGLEENILLGHKLSAGSGDRYVNIFPLMTTGAVYDGQRSASDRKRVFILSRSAFAGDQRYAVTAWSGDINSDFLSFRRQIPAGLNFALSGIPYWTTDIGGFVSVKSDDPAYRELFVRWFQYGSFCPIFRVHGTRSTDQNELWSYGPDAQAVLTKFDRLRYRLLPYIYSMAWMTTSQSYTPMRPLAMDYRTDVRALNIGDQYMYGPAFLVSPVTEPGATTRRLYLPQGKWYDFWSGTSTTGGNVIDAAAPLDRMPLYIRAGSILPMGPELEWSTQKPADPIEVRVYRGADGDFTIYEDENDTYNYEKGAYSTIPLHWDDSKQALTIGDRHGQFPGMLESRTFRVTFVGENHGVGVDVTVNPDTLVTYAGKTTTVTP
jgi:alpha-D-xyloside xylohydrolase